MFKQQLVNDKAITHKNCGQLMSLTPPKSCGYLNIRKKYK